MIEIKNINNLVQRFMDLLPPGVTQFSKELEKNFRQVLTSAFHQMDLVTREEFDAQTKVLMRTREQLEKLEQKIKMFEDKK